MRIGAFLNTPISFVTIAAAIFFTVVKPSARLQGVEEEETLGSARSIS